MQKEVAELSERQTLHQLEMQEVTKQMQRYEEELHHLSSSKDVKKGPHQKQCDITSWTVTGDQIELDSPIEKGARWGTVYKGKVKVAIKRLNPKMPNKERLLDILESKISVLVLIRHPNIQQLITAVFEEQHMSIIAELLDTSLHVAYQQEKLSDTHHLSIFQDTAQALDYLHVRDIVHGDINCANILLKKRPDGSYQAKVSDLGSATIAREFLTMTEDSTSPYHAPEILPDQPPSKAEDIFSYGIMLCEVITAGLPDKDKLPSVVKQTSTYPRPQIHQLIMACIDRDPDRRPHMKHILSKLQSENKS